MDTIPSISLIVCTHNRADILDHSLSFYTHIKAEVDYEILVVANACTDHTLDVIRKHIATNPKIKHVEEATIGHSNARNTGLHTAKAPFVFYIDDDAYPNVNLIDELHRLINLKSISCISGRTVYWDYNSPKWIKPSFVEVPLFREDFGEMPNGGYINGCACGFSTDLLKEVGGFNAKLGMVAKNVGYYDEVAAQQAIAAAGYKINYDPSLLVHHQSHSKTVRQFLSSAYKKGEYRKKAQVVKPLNSFILGCFHLLKGVFLFLTKIRHGVKTAAVESFAEPFIYFGQAFG